MTDELKSYQYAETVQLQSDEPPEQESALLSERTGISTNALKLWAIVSMAFDHFAYLTDEMQAAYYQIPWIDFHAFGRIAAPIFFYLIAVGYARTRNANKYTLRLFVFALISYIPYIWYLKGSFPNSSNFMQLNVIFTMLFGLLLLRSIYEVKNPVLKALCIILCLIGGYWCDYSLYGIAMILICYVVRGNRVGTIVGMAAAIMIYFYLRISSIVPSDLNPMEQWGLVTDPGMGWIRAYAFVLICQLLPLILIAQHRIWFSGFEGEKKPGFFGKWGFYIFYPAHLTVFLVIRMLFFGTSGDYSEF